MDIKSLKLELLERISLLEDEARLMALKRLLDAPRGYGIPNENLSVVKEGQEPYFKLEDRNYTADEVQALLRELLTRVESDIHEMDREELAALEESRQQFLRGEGKWYTPEELDARMKERRGD